MKNIYELFDHALSIVEECCGDVVEPINEVRINYRSKKRWGMCKYTSSTDSNVIEISNRILGDDVPYEKVLQVVVHEVLHATYGCHNHGKLWKRRAAQVMEKYPELNISRCNSASEFGVSEYKCPEKKYAVQCPICKRTWRRAKQSKLITQTWRYSCKMCSAKLVRIL